MKGSLSEIDFAFKKKINRFQHMDSGGTLTDTLNHQSLKLQAPLPPNKSMLRRETWTSPDQVISSPGENTPRHQAKTERAGRTRPGLLSVL